MLHSQMRRGDHLVLGDLHDTARPKESTSYCWKYDVQCRGVLTANQAVTGRCFGEKGFRSGLENGILLCELLNSIKPGLVKKVNRLPTPIAGLDNITLFLRGCEELGLKGTQLFDPSDLQDTSIRANIKGSDCCRKLKNVLITIYWLGKAANSCASYSGPTLNLKEFEGLLSQMRKEAEDLESPKRSIRDSGYIDCWDSERSDSLSPPRHGRDDSFDSLDSFGSRSQQTPSPDVVIRGSSDGRGSDSESDVPHRKMPDTRKDDMLARRTSCNEPRSAMPFNQYLPNKSNHSAYVPTPLRKKAADGEEFRKSWSTATSPIGGERPFSHPETIEEENCEDDGRAPCKRRGGPEDDPRAVTSRVDNIQCQEIGQSQSQTDGPKKSLQHMWEGKDEEEVKRLQRLEKAGIRVLPASVRYSSPKPASEESQPAPPDIILRRENDFLKSQQERESDSEEEEQRLPDIEKDDLASRKARMNQLKPKVPHNQFLPMPCSKSEEKWENIKKATHRVTSSSLDRQLQGVTSESQTQVPSPGPSEILTRRENPFLKPLQNDSEEEEQGGQVTVPNVQRDDLAKRRAQGGPAPYRETQPFVKASITQSDLEKWERLKLSTDTSESQTQVPSPGPSEILTRRENPFLKPLQNDSEEEEQGGQVTVPNVQRDDLAKRRAQGGPAPYRETQPFVKASITQSDLEKWERLKLSTDTSESQAQVQVQSPSPSEILTRRENPFLKPLQNDSEEEEQGGQVTVPNVQRDDLAKRRAQGGPAPYRDTQPFVKASITQSDLEKWERLKLSTDTSEGTSKPLCQACMDKGLPAIEAETAALDDLASRRARANRKALGSKQRFVHFGPVTEIDQKCWEKLSIARAESESESAGYGSHSEAEASRCLVSAASSSIQHIEQVASEPQQSFIAKYCPGSFSFVQAVCTPTRQEGAQRPAETQEDSEEGGQEERQPNPEKDDMLARRTGAFQKTSSSPTYNKFLPMPASLQQKKEGTKGTIKEEMTKQSSSSALSSPEDQYRQVTPTSTATVSVTTKESPRTTGTFLQLRKREMAKEEEEEQEEEAVKESFPDLEKDDMMSCRALAFHRQTATAASQFLPVPASQQTGTSEVSQCLPVPASQQTRTSEANKDDDKPRRRPSWLDDDLPPTYSHRASVSDDAESMSMIDMRCEEEAILQPHSKARHEHLHDLHNRLREEEDKWQDDLARWKNRRRSASQDLIKKEEERKKVERLMSGDRDLSERRKSIKTYREIVEEKERREKELHEAYKNARSPEEAETILRRYTQRFTVSEAVLEGLEMPKFLQRSLSVDSDTPLSPTKEASNPMKYLRQQSLPAPKFTATVEATISVVPQPQVSPPQTSPTQTVSTKAVPILSPKPYSQPKNSQPGLRSFTVDGIVRVNGEAFSGAEAEKESTPVKIPPTKSQGIESTARVNTAPVKSHTSPFKSQENTEVNTSPAKIHLESRVDASPVSSPEKPPVNSQKDTCGMDSAPARPTSLLTDPCRENLVSEEQGLYLKTQQDKETEPSQKDEERAVQALETPTRSVEISVVTEQKDDDNENSPREGHLNVNYQSTAVLNTVQYSLTTKQPEQKNVASETRQVSPTEILTSYLPVKKELTSSGSALPRGWESCVHREFFTQSDSGPSEENSNIPVPPFSLPKRNDYWSWDPEEERKRQERWQQEQERLLQEKYQREQEKLKQEWERAQKEVEEEERRYHEEERKILEETVAPLTPRSSTLSSPSRSDQPLLPLDPEGPIVMSLADWERKQELLEKQAQRSKAEACEKDEKPRQTTNQQAVAKEQEPTVKTEEQVKVTESSHSHTETLAQSKKNSQKLLSDNSNPAASELEFISGASWNNKQPRTKQPVEVWRKTASLDRSWSQTAVAGGMKRSGSYENLGTTPSKSSPCSPNLQTQSPNRSISGKKLCSSCAQPLGKGAAMIIETLSLYFHIQCFKCGVCKGHLGDTTTGTDVRIRNGILNCNECYIRSRTAGQPTTL
ncbi:LIM and calponin homology domains-containing protein 1-like isoform X3 [Acipenser ruthenus]|uniref:LIM and calponin homology domains-containing protein 1-like isoform X3 n=1 Tax=Acipenser ruthenus TaxID=7906 RepID=UPI00274100CC|nr:LIM and calponin homology domains-containing protein 1-like isoform X3 [Acipenser ruthenus]